MDRASLTLVVALACAIPTLSSPSCASAQEEEARILFVQGNEHLARGMRGPARRRAAELSEAIDAYLGVLRLGARTRNVIFNLGLASERLDRHSDAFNYYSEYLRSFDLTEDERAEGTRRLAAVRSEVAVLNIRSRPEGADVRIDRNDLPVRGQTPLELAVPDGSHTVLLSHSGYRASSTPSIAATGQSTDVSVDLVPEQVMLQIIAPSRGRLLLDGVEIEAGRSLPVDPGTHVARLEIPNAPPVEQPFEVPAGSPPMTLPLRAPIVANSAHLGVSIGTEADVFLDDMRIGSGVEAETMALPGPHRLRVSAPGFADAYHELNLSAQEHVRLDVSLSPLPDLTGMHTARAVFGVSAMISTIVLGGFGLNVLSLNSAWDTALAAHRNNEPGSETPAQLDARIDEIADWALAADVMIGVTGALALTAVILLLVEPDGGAESTVTVGGAASEDAAMITIGGRL